MKVVMKAAEEVPAAESWYRFWIFQKSILKFSVKWLILLLMLQRMYGMYWHVGIGNYKLLFQPSWSIGI